MATNDKKKQQVQPSVYGGAYDQQINNLANQINNRPEFSYDLNGDALYQQYKNQYTENARRSMKDTMGQASSLTGGYGNTYAQRVGQQAYDQTMSGLNDIVPQLEDRAYQRYKDQGDQIMTQFNIANTLGAADQATRQRDQEWAQTLKAYEDSRADTAWDQNFRQTQYEDQKTQQAYENMTATIMTSGYLPTADELSKSGISKQQAEALRNAWIASNPNLAYMLGALSVDDYFKLTGMVAPGSVVPSAGGIDYTWYPQQAPNNDNSNYTLKDVAATAEGMSAGGESRTAINRYIQAEVNAGTITPGDARVIKKDRQVRDRL